MKGHCKTKFRQHYIGGRPTGKKKKDKIFLERPRLFTGLSFI